MQGITVWVTIRVDRVPRSVPLYFQESGLDPFVAGYFVCTRRADLSPSALARRSRDVTALIAGCHAQLAEAGQGVGWQTALPALLSAATTDAGARGLVANAWEFLVHLSENGDLPAKLLWSFLKTSARLATPGSRWGGDALLSHVVPNALAMPAGLFAALPPRRSKSPAAAAGGTKGRKGQTISFPEEVIEDFFLRGLRRDAGSSARSHASANERLAGDYQVMEFCYFLLLAFGCLRKSEPLHLFTEDVSFDFDAGSALVSLWHPVTGPAPAMKDGRRPTREEFLRDEFGLVPRTADLGDAHVGWKNLLLDEVVPGLGNRARVAWIVPEAGVLFWRLHQAYLDCVRSKALSHPFYFSSTSNNSFGTPWTRGSVDSAFAAALGKIGLQPDASKGLAPHGFRHRGARWMDEARLSPMEKQSALHQQSVESQKAYGRVGAIEVSRLLADAAHGRGPAAADPSARAPSLAAFRLPEIGRAVARQILEKYDDLV